ncbi:ATP-dependent zinc protease family protein [Leptospira sp. GIMC2001]|uniref:ATP-dependent zinc protease family protein n=1 Tax=Leptospira sp. GIMC2001 TaxID=1513297 RepID=UPI002349DABD|nr:RimK/LysX family protein [Leptospira sp. GIMC2001]WCL50078.1 RimK/LysX family protein [Leptospira sp. GIMC2001]
MKKLIFVFLTLFITQCAFLNFRKSEPEPPEKKVVIVQTQYPKPLVGRVEWADLPDYNLHLRARIDTGAKTCSMHATNIEPSKEGEDLFVYFDTISNDNKKVRLKAKVLFETKVTSTSGVSESRYVILTKVKLGKLTEEVKVNLNDRTNLTYNFLVGRNLLMGNFVVDVSSSHVLGD